MKKLKKNQLYDHLNQFLKNQGMELSDGAIAGTLQKGCHYLTEAINLTQHSVETARSKVDGTVDRLRQKIHNGTAPKDRAAAPSKGRTAVRKKAAKRRAVSPLPARKGHPPTPSPGKRKPAKANPAAKPLSAKPARKSGKLGTAKRQPPKPGKTTKPRKKTA